MSAIGGKADIVWTRCNVRYWPKADKLIIPPNVGFGDKENITVDGQNVRL
jgi:hypothetical protein